MELLSLVNIQGQHKFGDRQNVEDDQVEGVEAQAMGVDSLYYSTITSIILSVVIKSGYNFYLENNQETFLHVYFIIF